MKPPNHGLRVQVTGAVDGYSLTGYPLYSPDTYGRKSLLGDICCGLLLLNPRYEGEPLSWIFASDRLEVQP